jgi:hypothetical protein
MNNCSKRAALGACVGANDGADIGAGIGAVNGASIGAGTASRAAPSPLSGGDGARRRPRGGVAAAQRPAIGAPDGAAKPGGNGAGIGALPYDAELVIYRLEEAGSTLLALPMTGWSTRLRTSKLDVVQAALESYGWEKRPVRPPVPSAQRITRMDEALSWIPLIPRERVVLRRIVGARALVSPTTERHLFSWRRLGGVMGADHKAVQRWHRQGVDIILDTLNRSR